MKSALLPLAALALAIGTGPAGAALPPATGLDAQLMETCNARMDARMEGMTQAELDYVRRAEFGLRLAMAPFRADTAKLSERELSLANADLVQARRSFARA